MKSVQDSLRAFVQGEEMVGSNAYKCSLCDAKVDTTKRTVFNALPPTLIFNLKRFEMDYNTMRTLKINDRIEFPMTLNMKPYTKVSHATARPRSRTPTSRHTSHYITSRHAASASHRIRRRCEGHGCGDRRSTAATVPA